jgi:hypothetical protein
MNLNRDEFLLLAHTGRGPHSTRAGPRPSERFEARTGGRWFRSRARGGLTLRRAGRSALRPGFGPPGGGSPRVSRTIGRLDEQTYFEMEFAVGFPAEEETLR